jgi:hypothetical protein
MANRLTAKTVAHPTLSPYVAVGRDRSRRGERDAKGWSGVAAVGRGGPRRRDLPGAG